MGSTSEFIFFIFISTTQTSALTDRPACLDFSSHFSPVRGSSSRLRPTASWRLCASTSAITLDFTLSSESIVSTTAHSLTGTRRVRPSTDLYVST